MPPWFRAAAPFIWLATTAIVAGGALAAAVAHRPTQPLVWLVAYLVLVVGVAQAVLGAGRAALATEPQGRAWPLWALLNLAHLGVTAGWLGARLWLVAAGTAAYLLAMLGFIRAVRGARGGWALWLYRVFALAMLASSLAGLVLAHR